MRRRFAGATFEPDASDFGAAKRHLMSAWITPARANALNMNAVAQGKGDPRGPNLTLVAGDSRWGCPTKTPWFEAPEGGYKGGGFLAVLDKNFKMQQCGYFPATNIGTVAAGNGTVVIASNATHAAIRRDQAKPDAPIADPVPLYHRVQNDFGGGEQDAWFAVFQITAN